MKKTISLLLSLMLILVLFSGCGGSSQSKDSAMGAQAASSAPAAMAARNSVNEAAAGFAMQEPVEMEMDMADVQETPASDDGIAGPGVNRVIDSRKIIKNVNMQLQTQTFDTSVEAIPKIAEDFGGYVQDSYVEGRDMYNERGMRHANFTVRIPAEKLDSFVNSVGSEFHVTSKSQNSQDITESYYDSKARLDALKIQEERLLEMLKQAAELEYLLQVEKELMNVRYEIESLTSSLNRMDSYVSMSTVTIYLNEVVKYEPVENVPVTFGERILRAFGDSWKAFGEFAQDFTVWFVAAFPFLLLIVAIAFVIILIVRRSVKRGEAKRAKKFYDAHPTPMPPAQPMPAQTAPVPPESAPTQEKQAEEEKI